jgi:hypothetical protein
VSAAADFSPGGSFRVVMSGYQEPCGRNEYGTPQYTQYEPQYAYHAAESRDSYGNSTYGTSDSPSG